MARIDLLFTQGKDAEYLAGMGVHCPCRVDELLSVLKQAHPQWQVAPAIVALKEAALGLMICQPNVSISKVIPMGMVSTDEEAISE